MCLLNTGRPCLTGDTVPMTVIVTIATVCIMLSVIVTSKKKREIKIFN